MSSSQPYILAVVQAIFVTVLWSSSWVIIKFGLEEISPFLFAGLRYLIGSFTLLFFLFFYIKKKKVHFPRNKAKSWWILVIIYGIIFITLTQGSQYLALSLLPAITVSFVLNLTPFVVILISNIILNEKPSLSDIILYFIMFLGIILYFVPLNLNIISYLGILGLVVLISSNSLSSILGRAINRSKESPLIITTLSMSAGAFMLFLIGIFFEDPRIILSLSFNSIIYILWLGIVNTAFAFMIWNKTLQILRAIDSTIINSLMLPQIVFLSLIFLGEIPILREWIGLGLLISSMFVFQFIQSRKLTVNLR